jgi:hypothetical protein
MARGAAMITYTEIFAKEPLIGDLQTILSKYRRIEITSLLAKINCLLGTWKNEPILSWMLGCADSSCLATKTLSTRFERGRLNRELSFRGCLFSTLSSKLLSVRIREAPCRVHLLR